MRDVDLNLLRDYACEDADITFRLKPLLESELQKSDMIDLFFNIETPLIPVLADMEYTGVKIDTQALNNFAAELRQGITEIEKKIHDAAGVEFNVSSPKQLGEILFDRLKIGGGAKTRTQQYSTAEDVLEKLADKHPIVPMILEYRSLKKLLSTYAEALPLMVNPKTGRIHTSYNQTVTATGRLSSTNPNLQNIPIREEAGRMVRRAFVPTHPDGCIMAADYSQIELRLMAHLSQDEAMIEAFRANQDIHAATAARLFHESVENVTREQRRKAKSANFGIIYGISSFGLAQNTGIKVSEAKEIIDSYFASFPGVKSYMDKSISMARDCGYTETLCHRRRYLPDLQSANSIVKGAAERNAINAPIQGTAADIIKIAMINIHRKIAEAGLRSAMVMQVHDELVFDVAPGEVETLSQIVKHEMESAIKLSIPLTAEVGIGSNWLEAH
jgi:DNA polymerase-1